MIKLHNPPPTYDSPLHKMQDGDVGVITYSPVSGHTGVVVQRYKNNLVRLGCDSGKGWTARFYDGMAASDSTRVRILKSGELLEIV